MIGLTINSGPSGNTMSASSWSDTIEPSWNNGGTVTPSAFPPYVFVRYAPTPRWGKAALQAAVESAKERMRRWTLEALVAWQSELREKAMDVRPERYPSRRIGRACGLGTAWMVRAPCMPC